MVDFDKQFQKLLRGHCSREEAEQLLNYFSGPKGDASMVRLIEQYMDTMDTGSMPAIPSFPGEPHIKKLRTAIRSGGHPVDTHRFQWPRITRLLPYAAAAIFVFTVGLGVWFYFQPAGEHTGVFVENSGEIRPGASRATLIRADGRSISLDETLHGIVMDNSSVYYPDGSVVIGGSDVLPAPEKLILATPRGGIYRVILSDGTTVWLNSESQLSYPSRFDGPIREVELVGEAYFEVASAQDSNANERIPFHVKTDRQIVKILGTHFNIKSYPGEENDVTTLVEGRVQVTPIHEFTEVPSPLGGQPSEGLILAPGQQSLLSADHWDLRDVDAESLVSWKDGFFYFDGQDIRSLMRMFSRWYDVDIEYRGKVTDHRFGGTLSKYEEIGEVLSKLSMTRQVQFKIEGRTIIVMP